jgi:hypothetical protein
MSPRSLLLAALLLAASAVAQQSDVFVSYWINMTATRLCAIDDPRQCYLLPKVDVEIDRSTTYAVIVWLSGNFVVSADPAEYSMLDYVMQSGSRPWYVVSIKRPGLLYSFNPFRVRQGNLEVSSSTYRACGQTFQYAVYIPSPGSYNITPFAPPHYILDLSTCTAYRITATRAVIRNATAGWFSLYIATMYPHVHRIYRAHDGAAINGTLHAYLMYFHSFLFPRGHGFYIIGRHAAPTLVMPYYYGGSGFTSFRGPIAYDAWTNRRLSSGAPGDLMIAYNIGLFPGDGFMMALLVGAVASPGAQLIYIGTNTTGYFVIERPYRAVGAGYAVFNRRFDVTEVALVDGPHVYNVRGIACPIMYHGVGWGLNRLDRVAEVEICNNRTDTVYIALYATLPTNLLNPVTILPGYYIYLYGDAVKPGDCARLRWDAAVMSRPTLMVFTSPQNLCLRTNHILSTTNYSPGWRYYLIGNSLVSAGPIAPDYEYASAWLQLLEYLRQRYLDLLRQLLSQLNATKTRNATAPLNLTSVVRQHQFLGTIRMESATSTWLRTTLNELQKWRVVGVAPSPGVAPAAVPAATVSAAAAASVAVAWAASRRSMATAAFLAGFAVLASALFVYYLYGASVTAGLVFAAVLLMSIGAAAAWLRRPED